MRNEDSSISTLILTALPLETRAVRSLISGLTERRHRSGSMFEIGQLPGGGAARIALAGTWDGNVSAAVVTERAIEMFRPRTVFFVGIAGGLWDNLALGDVVIAKRVYAVHGAKEEDGAVLARPRSYEAGHALLDLARYLDTRREVWEDSSPEPDGERAVFKVHFAPIAAGEVVLNSRESPLARQLHLHYEDSAAIEMESAGAAHAAHMSGVPMMTVRGISDHADGDKLNADAAGWQYAAVRHAALVAFAVIERLDALEGSESGPTGQPPGESATETAGPGDEVPSSPLARPVLGRRIVLSCITAFVAAGVYIGWTQLPANHDADTGPSAASVSLSTPSALAGGTYKISTLVAGDREYLDIPDPQGHGLAMTCQQGPVSATQQGLYCGFQLVADSAAGGSAHNQIWMYDGDAAGTIRPEASQTMYDEQTGQPLQGVVCTGLGSYLGKGSYLAWPVPCGTAISYADLSLTVAPVGGGYFIESDEGCLTAEDTSGRQAAMPANFTTCGAATGPQIWQFTAASAA